MKTQIKYLISALALVGLTAFFIQSCNTSQKANTGALTDSAASAVYVSPGEHDEFYGFFSGGFSGQVSVYGLPSGRLRQWSNCTRAVLCPAPGTARPLSRRHT